MTALYLIAGVALVAVIVIILIFNKLVRLRQNVRESWSAIDTELKRRYDLIPNLVETVKGYAGHEKSTLESVVAARSAAVNNTGSPGIASANRKRVDRLAEATLRHRRELPAAESRQSFSKPAGRARGN